MNRDCVWYYEEAEVNWRECKHPEYDEDWDCEGCEYAYDRETAKADAKYGSCDKY